MAKSFGIGWGVVAFLIAAAPAAGQSADQGILELPAAGSTASGIGIVSGWKCEAAAPLYASFDGGERLRMSYGTTREDTREICGDDDNAFVMLWNYGNLDPGEHVLEIWEGDVLWKSTTFSVESFGTPFLRGASGCYVLPDFPETGEETLIGWQTELQSFGLAEVCATPLGAMPLRSESAMGAEVAGVVEFPASGSLASGNSSSRCASAMISSCVLPSASTCNSGTIFDSLTIAPSMSVMPSRCINVGVVVSPVRKPRLNASSISWKLTESRYSSIVYLSCQCSCLRTRLWMSISGFRNVSTFSGTQWSVCNAMFTS